MPSNGRAVVHALSSGRGNQGIFFSGFVRMLFRSDPPGSHGVRLSEVAQQYGYRDRNKSENANDRKNCDRFPHPSVVFRMIESTGLEHAPGTVVQMQPQGYHLQNIKTRGIPHVKAGDYIMVDIARPEIWM
jgi:hypothetical protein